MTKHFHCIKSNPSSLDITYHPTISFVEVEVILFMRDIFILVVVQRSFIPGTIIIIAKRKVEVPHITCGLKSEHSQVQFLATST